MKLYRELTALLIVSLLLPSQVSLARRQVTSDFPRGCEEVGFSFDKQALVLNPEGQQSFYLMQNKANATVHLQYKKPKDMFMSPTFKADIAKKRWAGLASNEKNMQFQCTLVTKEAKTPIACQEAIRLCHYPKAKFALSNEGNYWVSRNQSLRQSMYAARKKGIRLRW